MNAITELRQRADYTHKHNTSSGRHGWLRLTPAYSVKVVEEILSHYEHSDSRVLDPFCGSGTTALAASALGTHATTTDINPFLIWLATAKTRNYKADDIKDALSVSNEIAGKLSGKKSHEPSIHNIERWWTRDSIDFLCRARFMMEASDAPTEAIDLVKIAFCRTLIKLSSAAFNHQSMSFKEGPTDEYDLAGKAATLHQELEAVAKTAREKLDSVPVVAMEDARKLSPEKFGKFDLVVTSPPYANRMSYIRELRPYMYWLGYLNEAKEAGELDWQAIGGTWGIATSRLNEWQADSGYENMHLSDVLDRIASADNKHAKLLSVYVHKYCDDIFKHLSSLARVLNSGARVHYIVGNSTFYGNLVKVEEVYADIMSRIGFVDVCISAIRKRNSKKELVEFDVSATWP
jgi:SAM-dependent methyltransferase